MVSTEEPIAKKQKTEDGEVKKEETVEVKAEVSNEDAKVEEVKKQGAKTGEAKKEVSAEKETKEGKEGKEDKEKKEKKEKKEGKEGKEEKKEKKEGKDEKKEKKDHDSKEEKKEKKEKDGKDLKNGKEGKDGKSKEKKEKKDKKEKKEKDGKHKKEKHDKKDKDVKATAEGKEKKDKKDKKDKKEKKDRKEGKGSEKKKKTRRTPKQGGMLKVKKSDKKVVAKKFGKFAKGAKKKAAEAAPTKVLLKSEEDYEPVNRWWEREDGALSGKRGAKKWDTFEHHGLLFAPEYVPNGLPIKYDGKELNLNIEAEELAVFWVAVKGSEYEHKDIFINNFFTAFKKALPEDTPIKEFSKCDFSLIAKHREDERQARLNRSKEEKEAESKKNSEELGYFTHALVNGIREKLGAIKMEPPSLFRGRGEHPKQGMVKTRTFPENVVINIGREACVPKPLHMPGHAWKDVVHEQHVQWIASFDDNVGDSKDGNDIKYVSFAATSGLKGQPDLLKYDRAKRLVGMIGNIRASYEKLLKSKSLVDRQKATVTYFIDKLALRVGGEKNTEEEADTVGCCSLRVEHLKLEKPNKIHFDFLGKDSIRYENTVPVTEEIMEAVDSFMVGKKPEQQVFDKVDPGVVNEYFKEFMDDLSAKVFRTYNASFTLQKELDKFDVSKKDAYTQDELLKFYNDANRAVAILCNHQKAESKQHQDSMKKMQAVKVQMEKSLKTLKKHMATLQAGGDGKPVKDDGTKLPKDPISCKKRIAETKLRLDKHVNAMTMKEDNKTVALGTSKMNYMDPRISVAWCKKVDLAIEKVFPRTVRTKFPWAMHFKSSYVFK